MLSRPGLRSQIAGRLAAAGAGAAPDDRTANPGLPSPPGGPVAAAVLVPLVERRAGVTVLLTVRTATVAVHAGQISFPGGRIEAEDASPVAAALRETHEEIGVGAEHIEVAGRLADYETGTGFRVTPVVGFLHGAFALRLSPAEVADAFEVPLAFVLDPAHHARETAVLRGAERTFWVLRWRERRIWGATAGMLVNLAGALAGLELP